MRTKRRDRGFNFSPTCSPRTKDPTKPGEFIQGAVIRNLRVETPPIESVRRKIRGGRFPRELRTNLGLIEARCCSACFSKANRESFNSFRAAKSAFLSRR